MRDEPVDEPIAFASSATAMNSSALCAWSIEPGPITTDGTSEMEA
jgi:hypothetical protein